MRHGDYCSININEIDYKLELGILIFQKSNDAVLLFINIEPGTSSKLIFFKTNHYMSK